MTERTAEESSVLAKARAALAAGTATFSLVEDAYAIVEHGPHDPLDDPVLQAAMDLGIVQEWHFREANGVDGWSRLYVHHPDGRRESIRVLVYDQPNPRRVHFDCDLQIAASRIAKALATDDPRHGEISMLTLSRAAVRKSLSAQVAGMVRTAGSDEAVAVIYALEKAWDDHHRLYLAVIAETPVTSSVAA